MGRKLHKLGEYIYSHPFRTLSIWGIILAVMATVGLMNAEKLSSAITIPGTQAQTALDKMQETFPDLGAGSGRVVFHSLNGTQISDHKDVISNVVSEIAKVDGVNQSVNPFEVDGFISEKGDIAYSMIQLNEGSGSISEETINKIAEIVEGNTSSNLQIERGGDIISSTPSEILGVGEIAGVGIALLVLIITFGSLVAAGMPIIVAILAVGVSMGGLFGLSKILDLTSTTPVMAVMLGLAVGIDYSLFIISKYLHYRHEGYDAKTAIGKASGTAGNAVIFAAGTVVIALAALSVAGIPFMTIMGLAGAATVAVAAIVAVTIIPAMVRIFGSSLFSIKLRKELKKSDGKIHKTNISKKTAAYKWGSFVVRRPVISILGVIVLTGVLAIPVGSLKLGLPSDSNSAESSTERKAYDLINEGFGAGYNYTIAAYVEGIKTVDATAENVISAQVKDKIDQEVAVRQKQAEEEIQQRIANASSLEEVTTIQQAALQQQQAAQEQIQAEYQKQVEAAKEQYAKYYYPQQIADGLKTASETADYSENPELRAEIASARAVSATDDGGKAVIQITPKLVVSDEKDYNTQISELIGWLRSEDAVVVAKNTSQTYDLNISVTGSTAMQEDIEKKLADALPLYLTVVVGLSLIILVVAFRSILVPIKATLGFLFSVAVMFGAMVAVFQWGMFGISDATGPLMSFIPIISIGILFGLAMDYEFFLVSSMKEAYEHGKDKSNKHAKEAIVKGFASGAKVVTAAAIIMISVFAGFIFNHDNTIKAIGLGLAVGVFVDAFIIRMIFVTAVLSLLGRRAWQMPTWMEALVPNISIEGEADEEPEEVVEKKSKSVKASTTNSTSKAKTAKKSNKNKKNKKSKKSRK